jgi:hypothetical protein
MDDQVPFPPECVELPLLLPAWQLAALGKEAARRGLTVGQFLRRLIRDWLAEGNNRCQDREVNGSGEQS